MPVGFRKFLISALLLTLLALGLAFAASQSSQSTQTSKPGSSQDVPDAPSAVQPPPPPPPPAAPTPQAPPVPASDEPPTSGAPGDSTSPTGSAPPNGQQGTQPNGPPGTNGANGASDPLPPGSPPPFKITTVPLGAEPSTPGAQQEIYKLSVNINQILVPVRVTDDQGHLVAGLLHSDFSVYEDDKKQTLNFFTSDPFALSAAVLIDFGLPDVAIQKINQTYPALEGAFSAYDEVSLFAYSNTVTQLTDFGSASARFTAALNSLKTKTGANNGVPITGGPLSDAQGPVVNGIPINPQAPTVVTPERTAHVLNDAILAAAKDLASRDRARRRVIFVISDGREYRSDASYGDVLRVLLTNNIMVYGVGVENAAIPGYNKLSKLRLPKFGYTDILPKYANATGGEIMTEYSKDAIESVYQRIIGAARNEYTLGYATRATADNYREIEVRVDRPSCRTDLRPCVNVFAKAGYYPLPPGR